GSEELRDRWGASSDDLVALSVGRVAAEKNLALVVEAYRAMQRVASRTRLVVVGDGPFRPLLEAKEPDVIFCGVRTGTGLAAHYAAADVFLFPSETETFGNVTLEAMASGLVVVAYDYAAARAHIRHGETGLLVPYGDARAFVEAAVGLARSPASLPALRQQAREQALSLDWGQVVARFEALLTGALGPAPSPDAVRLAPTVRDMAPRVWPSGLGETSQLTGGAEC